MDATLSRITPWLLFTSFMQISLAGFGGVLPHARRMLVERRGWISDREMTDLLGLGQLLPGPNIVNVAIMLGLRRCGVRGAIAGPLGLLVLPLALFLALGATYDRFAEVAWLQGAFQGVAAAAAGLILGLGVRLAHALPPRPVVVAIGAAGFVAVAVLHLPLPWVVLALAPLGVRLAWQARA